MKCLDALNGDSISQKFVGFVRNVLTPLVVLLTFGLAVYDHLVVRLPLDWTSPVDGVSLGRVYAPSAGSSLGDGWDAAADVLERGRSVADAQVALQETWQQSRSKAFARVVAPEFARVLAEGSEPTSPSQRAKVVKLWRDFASGLKGGR